MKNFWLVIDGMKKSQSCHYFVLVTDYHLQVSIIKNLEVTTGSDFVVTCKFEIQNTGDISGLEIAQCYGLCKPSSRRTVQNFAGFC